MNKQENRWIVAVDTVFQGLVVTDRIEHPDGRKEIVSFATEAEANADLAEEAGGGLDTSDMVTVEVRIAGDRVFDAHTGREFSYSWK